MATINQANPRAVKGHMETVDVLIANGASWNAGQFLHPVSGKLTASASDAVNFKYVAQSTQADPGNATTYAQVWLITSDIVFEGNELNATASDASWIGNIYGIDVTSNVVTVDVAETSAVSVKVVDIASNYEPIKNLSTDTNPRIRFTVLQSILDAAGG